MRNSRLSAAWGRGADSAFRHVSVGGPTAETGPLFRGTPISRDFPNEFEIRRPLGAFAARLERRFGNLALLRQLECRPCRPSPKAREGGAIGIGQVLLSLLVSSALQRTTDLRWTSRRFRKVPAKRRRHIGHSSGLSAQGSEAPSAAATFLISARVRTTMSPARLPSLAILLSARRTSSRFGD